MIPDFVIRITDNEGFRNGIFHQIRIFLNLEQNVVELSYITATELYQTWSVFTIFKIFVISE